MEFIERIEVFKYLRQLLDRSYNDWLAVIQKLKPVGTKGDPRTRAHAHVHIHARTFQFLWPYAKI